MANLIEGLFNVIQGIFQSIFAVLQSFANVVYSLVHGVVSLVGNVLESAASLVGASVNFIISNIIVIGLVGVAFIIYTDRNKRASIGNDIKRKIAALFGFFTLLFSIAAYRILRWVFPVLSKFVPSRSIPKRKTPTTSSRGKSRDVKPKTGTPLEKRVTRSSTAATGGARRKRGKNVWWEGVYTTLLSTLGTGLILCSISSALLCAISLTSKGCETLRHLGLIEWLPWREGLKCYRTRWDWVADMLGEIVWTVLQGHEYGAVPLKSM
ncbi:hypothetical protein CI109_101934 [Kwoniella shandongensis]|uniref:Uncharacterized protein n=1 Tax=Kwoniella shandongensis TaxID=1734106 RepID=A0A5M6BWG6_9TREE|nr:uncharacterized protein CI109_005406 [Kwoniella shandongensis]KAA5526282.1 hypothetical protein CI109_005406 [Kwoniella shandongensis]